MKKKSLLIMILLSQVVVSLSLGSAAAYGYTYGRAPSGLIVWNQNLSGLNQSEVTTRLLNSIPSSVTYQGHNFPLKLERTRSDIEQWVEKVFQSQKNFMLSNLFSSFSKRASFVSLGLNREEITSQLGTLSKIINQPMKPATIKFMNGRLVRTDGQAGQELDVEGTWLKLSREHNLKQVPVEINTIVAKPNVSDVSKIRNILGDYTTYFNPEDVSRTKNVRLAAAALNNYLIAPGQEFSFNKVVGDCDAASGYMPAYVFAGLSVVLGDGGGVCQDSSTLFQAVQQAHLRIEERHAHSLPVAYVPQGQDATVSYGTLDFRFKNDTQGYLLISALTGNNWLRIRLFGLADDHHQSLQKPGGYPINPTDLYNEYK